MVSCGYIYTTLGELKIYSRTVRSSMCLPDRERALLLFILDRTIGWHRPLKFITLSEFSSGVRRRKLGREVVFARGTGLPPAQVVEGLEWLQRLGAIELEHYGPKVAYKLNSDWCHPDIEGSGMWELQEGDFEGEEDAEE
jgi:DNA-binding transcriptional ArsR family regulator